MTASSQRHGDVRLELPSESVKPGETIPYVLINDSDVAILTGGHYALERLTDAGWESVPLDMWFAAVGIVVRPDQRQELRAPLPEGACPGRYRFRKSFRSGVRSGLGWSWQEAERELTADLEIEPAHDSD